MSGDFGRGFVIGFVIVAVVFVIIAVAFKMKNCDRKYDERQLLARGRAYKHGFIVLLLYCVAAGIADMYLEYAYISTVALIGVFLSVTVFVIECVFTDAYFAVGQKPRSWLVLSGFVAAMNLWIFAYNIAEGQPLIENGVLTYYVINLVCGVMFLAIFAAIVVKLLRDRAGERSER